MGYIQEITVRFEDVDYARVVFFPRILEYCHHVFEDFFGKEVGITYAELIQERKVGFPVVHAEADYQAPFYYGMTFRVELSIVSIGNSSVKCRYRFFAKETDRLSAEIILIPTAIAMDSFRATPIPDDIREVFVRYLETVP